MNTNLPIIGSPSRTETASRCHRRHFVADVLCLKPRKREEMHLAFGTVIHAAAAEWWRTGDQLKTMTALTNAWSEHREYLDNTKLSFDLAMGMMTGYCGQAQLTPAGTAYDADSPPNLRAGKIVSIEQRIVLDLGLEARLAFQLDRLTDDDGFVLTDTKTAGRFDKHWFEQWARSLQQKLYRVAIREHYNRPVERHYIEGVLKKLPTQIEYVPLPVWSDAELAEAVRQFKTICQKDARLVARAMKVGGEIDVNELFDLAVNWTEFNPHDCDSYGVKCPVYDVCQADPDDRVGMLLADFEHVPPDYLD